MTDLILVRAETRRGCEQISLLPSSAGTADVDTREQAPARELVDGRRCRHTGCDVASSSKRRVSSSSGSGAANGFALYSRYLWQMLPLEPLYGSAVLHLAWLITGGKRRLVFGYVECLPSEVPPPIDDGEYDTKLPGSRHRLYARHVPLTFEVAVEWYQAAIRGEIVRPNKDGSLPKFGEPGTLAMPELHQDVVWPRTLCVRRDAAPFLSLWHRTPRMHHLLSLKPWLVDELNERELQATTDFAQEHFGFSLAEWDAFWGSLHLVLPDPFHRSIAQWFDHDADGEILVVGVKPRQGVPAGLRPPMTLTVLEQRESGVAAVLTKPLPAEGEVRFRLSPRLAAIGLSVADDDGTVYAVRAPTHTIQSVAVQGQAQNSRRRVQLPARGQKPATEYEVGVEVTTISSSVGPSDAPNAQTMLARMSDRQKVAGMGRQLEQRWFYRERTVAEEYLRALVGRAQRRLLFVDAYITHYELLRYALAAKQHRLPIQILTSSLPFGEEAPQADPVELLAAVTRARADNTVGTIEVKVMSPKELHDRFLLVDDRLYSLGGSLSEMGHRGMMVIRVPDPTPILATLTTIWRAAPALATWIAERPAAASRLPIDRSTI